jgi:hypothetical protein
LFNGSLDESIEGLDTQGRTTLRHIDGGLDMVTVKVKLSVNSFKIQDGDEAR